MDPIAILTGASSGIGAAAAQQFVERGYTVINISRRDCPVPGVETLATDLADEQSADQACTTLASRVANASGAPVYLVHNASLMLKIAATPPRTPIFPGPGGQCSGHQRLNRSLLPLMPAGSSVLYVGSTLSEKAVAGLQLHRQQACPAGHDAGNLSGPHGQRHSHRTHLSRLHRYQHAAPACQPRRRRARQSG